MLWANEMEWNILVQTATSRRRVGLKSGLLAGGILSPIGFILMVVLYTLSSSSADDAVETAITLAYLAWLLLLLVHPVVASFIAVRHTQRLRSGIVAGIIAGCLYVFVNLVALALTFGLGYGAPSPGNDSSPFLRFDALFFGYLGVVVVYIGIWLLPSAALATLGGLAANIVARRKP